MYVEKYQIRYVCRNISNTLCMYKNIKHVMYVEAYQTRYGGRKTIKNVYVEKYQIRYGGRKTIKYVMEVEKLSNTLWRQKNYQIRYVCRNISNTLWR